MYDSAAAFLFPTQLEFIKAERRKNECYKHPALVAGYGYGKTRAALYKALDLCDANRGYMGAIYMPTHALILNVLLPAFEEMKAIHEIPATINKSEFKIFVKFSDGSVSTILLASMDRPERIVGYNLAWFICDEIDTLPLGKAKNVWDKANGRLRVGNFRQGAVVGTPESLNFLYKFWQEEPPSEHYKLYRASSLENPFLPDDFFQTMYDSYGEKAIQAYIHGKFVNLFGDTVYDAFDRDIHVKTPEEMGEHYFYNARTYQYYTGMDFGWTNPSSILFIKVHNNIAYVYDQFERSKWKLWDFLDGSLEKAEGPSVADWHDPAGKQQRENAPRTNVEIMRSRNMNPRHLIATIMEGVNVTNNMFEKMRLFISPKCRTLIENLESHSRLFNDRGEWIGYTEHDKHGPDGLRYFCYGTFGRQSELFKTITEPVHNRFLNKR